MSEFRYDLNKDNIAIITMDMADKSANTMGDTYLEAMEQTVGRLEQDQQSLKGAVITSAKNTFFAGADLNVMLALRPAQKEQLAQRVEAIKAQLRRLEKLEIPVVAAINGAALGGGYEIALACHHRILLDHPKAVVGLPEVTLGLMPGSGGTVRLIRKLGLLGAFPFLSEGRQLKSDAALKASLVDELASDLDDLMTKACAWIKANPSPAQPWDQRGYRIPGGGPENPKVFQALAIAPAMLRKKTQGLMPAPEAIMAAGVEGSQVDFDTALRIEGRYFTQLAFDPVARNMINTFFFQLNSLKNGASRPAGIERHTVRQVGLLGAGMMGAAIAYVAARSGINVVLKDVTMENAEHGKDYSRKLLEKQVSRGHIATEKSEQVLALIQPTAEAADLAGCELIIEAVFEKLELKHQVIAEAEQYIGSGTLMASNTSTLPITQIAEGSRDAANFIGLHFFSPVDKMPLVEIIRGRQSSDESLARAFDFVLQIRKTPIVVNDSRGFFTSRVFGTYLDEGAALLEEGISPAVIENLARAAGMPVGPLAQQDEVSQKLAWDIISANRARANADGEDLPESASERVVGRLITEFERMGKAYGAGYYEYPETGRKYLWPDLTRLYHQAEVKIPDRDIKQRLLFRQSIEAVKCLQENVLTSVTDGNIGSIFGIGFPPHTGGQFQYINYFGVSAFVERARELADAYGERFDPPQLLLEKAAKSEQFS